MTANEHNAIYDRAVEILRKYVPLPHEGIQFVCRPLTPSSAKVKAKFMAQEGIAWVDDFEVTARVWTGLWGYRICIYRTYADKGPISFRRKWYRG